MAENEDDDDDHAGDDDDDDPDPGDDENDFEEGESGGDSNLGGKDGKVERSAISLHEPPLQPFDTPNKF